MEESKTTNKRKKIIWISIVVAIIIVLIAGLTEYIFLKQKDEKDISRINQLYEILKTKTSYSFSAILDDNNSMFYAKEDNKAYMDTTYDGTESKFIIKDENTYLIMDDTKAFYTYQNNEIDLNKIEVELEQLKDLQCEKGKEKIENKTYYYEEYEVLTDLNMMDTSEIGENEKVKTRFYFNDDKLVYIKTITENQQELLKVNISYDVDNQLFEIPSDYKEM